MNVDFQVAYPRLIAFIPGSFNSANIECNDYIFTKYGSSLDGIFINKTANLFMIIIIIVIIIIINVSMMSIIIINIL